MTDLAQALTDRAVNDTGSAAPGRPPAGRILTVLIPLAVLVAADLPAVDGLLGARACCRDRSTRRGRCSCWRSAW